MEDTESCSSRALDTSPSQSRKLRQKIEVYRHVLRRLKESNNEEASQPGFDDELWAHFNRLPIRYALDVNVERTEDVLVHKKLLHMAHDPTTRPAFEVRLVQVHPVSDKSCGDSLHSNFTNRVDARSSDYLGSTHSPPAFGLSPSLELALEISKSQVQVGDSATGANLHIYRPLHEITVSTNDKPKLLSQLTSLFSEIGLNIQEAHAFSTTDGYVVGVFVLDGWPFEETKVLRDILTKEIPRIEKPSWSKPQLVSPAGEYKIADGTDV